MRKFRILIGATVWIALICGGVYGFRLAGEYRNHPVVQELQEFTRGDKRPLELEFVSPVELAVGDPIYSTAVPGQFTLVGRVVEVDDAPGQGVTRARAILNRHAPSITAASRLHHYRTDDDLRWIFETLLPPKKRRLIANQVRRAWSRHQAEMLRKLEPIVEAGFRDAFGVIRQDLPKSVRLHKDQLSRLGAKYQNQVIERELIPLVKAEIWPIVRKHAEPTVNRVARAIWERASLWRFGWRFLYDRAPFMPQKNLVKKEWKRFLNDDALPILKSHTSEFVWVQKRILTDVAKNQRVQQSVERSFRRISEDPQVNRLLWKIIRETVIENPRLHQVLKAHWKKPATQAAIEVAVERFESLAVEIGEMVIGSERAGITPEFAAVLRTQVLRKDQRWIAIETPSNDKSGETVHLVKVQTGGRAPIVNNPFVASLEGR